MEGGGWLEVLRIVVSALFGGGITAWFTLGQSKKKGKIDIIKELFELVEDKTRKIRDLNEEIIRLLRENHDLNMQLLSSRCDKRGCKWRKPPLPWDGDSSEDRNGDGLPDTDPEGN